MRPAGRPRTGLNTMIGFSGARPDKQFHSGNITDTEWKVRMERESPGMSASERCPAVSMVTVWWSAVHSDICGNLPL